MIMSRVMNQAWLGFVELNGRKCVQETKKRGRDADDRRCLQVVKVI